MKVAAIALLAGCNQLIDVGEQFTGPGSPPAQIDCAALGLPPTTISGTVYAPNGALPLYDALVFAPARPLPELADGPGDPGCVPAPLASTRSDVRGAFQLADAPAGSYVTLAIQLGKWRRVVTIPRVESCTSNPLPPELTRLPRDATEGHVPRLALTTGGADILECIVRELGVLDREVTAIADGGRVHLFRGTNGTGAIAGRGAIADVAALFADPAVLARYDAVLVGCDGTNIGTAATAQRLFDYANAGGVVWLSHFAAAHLRVAPDPGPSLATFKPTGLNLPADTVVTIDQSSPRGAAFAEWMIAVGVAASPTTFVIQNGRASVETADPARVERHAHLEAPQIGVQSFTWQAQGGGRLEFSDMHVGVSSNRAPYPQECVGSEAAQTRAIAFQLLSGPTCVEP